MWRLLTCSTEMLQRKIEEGMKMYIQLAIVRLLHREVWKFGSRFAAIFFPARSAWDKKCDRRQKNPDVRSPSLLTLPRTSVGQAEVGTSGLHSCHAEAATSTKPFLSAKLSSNYIAGQKYTRSKYFEIEPTHVSAIRYKEPHSSWALTLVSQTRMIKMFLTWIKTHA